MKVSVIGMGYVGLVTGACLSYLGHNVICYDHDSTKIKDLQKGLPQIYEKGLEGLLQIGEKSGLLTFTADPFNALNAPDVVIIAVGTPPLPSGEPDLSGVESAAGQIGKMLDPGKFTVIINKSTVPIGTWGRVTSIILNETAGSGDGHFAVVSNPEFLREGSAVSDTLYPSRIILGAFSRRAIQVTKDLYRQIIDQSFGDTTAITPRPGGFKRVEVITTDPVDAEMIKYASNAFLATKISFINDIANICERVGSDVTVVARGMGLDPRIGKDFLRAGIGWGGSCFGKDIAALMHTARENHYNPEMLDTVVRVNNRQRLSVAAKLEEVLGDLGGKAIGILGLSFKPNTNDIRNAPSVDIINMLLEKGASLKVYDPAAMEKFREQHPELPIVYEKSALETAQGTDGIVIVTEWDEFKNLDLDAIKSVMKKAIIIDGRNILDPAQLSQKGFVYKGIGR